MQDRPTADELLAAIAAFLRADVLPGTPGRLRFHLRVATNLLAVLRRELEAEPAARRREWAGLHALEGLSLDGPPPGPDDPPPPPESLRGANERLCAAIREGAYDADAPEGAARRTALLAHLRAVVTDKLRIANPAFLERVQQEQAGGGGPGG